MRLITECQFCMQPEAPNAQADSALLGAIVGQAQDAIIFADRDGAIRVWNRGAETIFGYSAAEAIGNNLDLIVPERFRQAHWAGFDKALASGEMKYAGRVLTTRSAHKDGRTLYVDLSFSLVRDADGAILGALAQGRDCTAAQLAAKAAAAAERK